MCIGLNSDEMNRRHSLQVLIFGGFRGMDEETEKTKEFKLVDVRKNVICYPESKHPKKKA